MKHWIGKVILLTGVFAQAAQAVDLKIEEIRLSEWREKNPGLSKLMIVNSHLRPEAQHDQHTGLAPIDDSRIEELQALAMPGLDADYRDPQLAEFIEFHNQKVIKAGNRRDNKVKSKIADEITSDFAASERGTTVIEAVVSADKPVSFEKLPKTLNQALELITQIDQNHVHLKVPSEVVNLALPTGHAALPLDATQDYLFTAIDLRTYFCNLASFAINQFAETPLNNETIYILSAVGMNSPEVRAWAQQRFQKAPEWTITQYMIDSSNIIRGGANHFLFFRTPSGRLEMTLVSQIAIGSGYLSGTKGAAVRPVLFDGISNFNVEVVDTNVNLTGNWIVDGGLSLGAGAVNKASTIGSRFGVVAGVGASQILTAPIGTAYGLIQGQLPCSSGLMLGLNAYVKGMFSDLVNELQ